MESERAQSLFEYSFQVGKFELNVAGVVAAILTLLLVWFLSRLMQKGFTRWAMSRQPALRPTIYTVSRLAKYVLIVIGVLVAAGLVGIPLTQFAVLAGAIGVGLGFGLQAIFSNFVSGLILLFDPPFDKGDLDPGYIKGYLPGIRENGGQYTHAATWVVLATALLGQGDRAAELFGLLNPINHADSPDKVAHYKVEPYVVAADVYGAPPHTGRGGWTWYTGSAGWLYRIGLEAILGFQLRGSRLKIEPCVTSGWPGYEITYRYGSATYHVVVENSSRSGRGIRSLTLDGQAVPGGAIDLANDGQRHEVGVTTATRQEEQSVRAAG